MQRHSSLRPPDLIEILLLIAIIIILGFAVIPQLHLYLYHKKALQIANLYTDTTGRLVTAIKTSPSGRRIYVLTDKKHSGIFSNVHDVIDDPKYSIGDNDVDDGSVYFSQPYFIIGYENRFIHSYFKADPDMALIYHKSVMMDSPTSNTVLCNGHRVLERVTMNFNIPKYNRSIKYKIAHILKSQGYHVSNFIVTEHINSAGDLCK